MGKVTTDQLRYFNELFRVQLANGTKIKDLTCPNCKNKLDYARREGKAVRACCHRETCGYGGLASLGNYKRERKWTLFPYGYWTVQDGTQVYFDRGYRQICHKKPDGSVEIVKASKWIAAIREQEFFYDDGRSASYHKGTQRKVMRIAVELGVLEEIERRTVE